MIMLCFVKLIDRMVKPVKKLYKIILSLSGQEVNYQKFSLYFDKQVPCDSDNFIISLIFQFVKDIM